MANIPKSQLDAVDTRVEVMLRRLFEGHTVNFEEINGVDIASPDDDDTLFYNLTLDLWENHPLKTINGESLKGPGNILVGGGGGSGTVTSVAFTAPSQFAVSGSPITTSGTLGLTWNNQVANRVLAGPATGADAAPTFRALVADDIPGLPVDQIRNFTAERLLGWGEVVSGDGNGALISTGTGFVWSGDSLNLSTNLQGWHAIAPSSKQDTLTPGQGINITTNTISVDATAAEIPYDNAVSGLTATDAQAAIDEIAASPGGGLTGFTSEVNTTAPNDVRTAHAIEIDSAVSNVDAVFSPKGQGSVQAHIPDNLAAGGNKRGQHSVDWQTDRSSASQVASGSNSVVVGGQNNTASNSTAAVCGGVGNTASGQGSFAGGGSTNTASALFSVCAGGSNNTASGTRSFVGGGFGSVASGERSWVPGGGSASTRGIYGAHAWTSTIRLSQAGDNQHFGMVVQNTTTNATATIITANRGAASSTNVNVLPNNSCWTGRIRVTGRSTAGDVYNVLYEVVAKRGASAATTAIADANPIHTYTDSGITGVSTSIVANTTRGSVEVEVTGLAATTIDWFAEFFGNQIAR